MRMRTAGRSFVAALLLVSCAGSDGAQFDAVGTPPPVGAVTTSTEPIAETSETPTTEAPAPVDTVHEPTEAPPITVGPVPEPVSAEPTRSITVGGVGADYGPPDRAVVDIGVTGKRPTVEEATSLASSAGSSLIAALEAAGVPASDIQTSRFSINPYHSAPNYDIVVGYDTTIGYRVAMSDVTELGAVLAEAVRAGGGSVRAWSVRFEGDPDDHMEVARAEAWDDVRERALATAAEIDQPLGDVLDVHEKVLMTSPQGMSQGGEGDSASFDIPISPGVVGVVVLLTVTYAIGA